MDPTQQVLPDDGSRASCRNEKQRQPRCATYLPQVVARHLAFLGVEHQRLYGNLPVGGAFLVRQVESVQQAAVLYDTVAFWGTTGAQIAQPVQ
jgi:hypothetical protein